MAKKKDSSIDPAPTRSLGSLGDVLRSRGVEVAEHAPSRPSPAPSAANKTDGLQLDRAGKIVVRRERKGHGGKIVTVVEGLASSTADLEGVARELRKTLGCGSWVDDRRIILQGDLARGAEAWLRARGATRIVQGN